MILCRNCVAWQLCYDFMATKVIRPVGAGCALLVGLMRVSNEKQSKQNEGTQSLLNCPKA